MLNYFLIEELQDTQEVILGGHRDRDAFSSKRMILLFIPRIKDQY